MVANANTGNLKSLHTLFDTYVAALYTTLPMHYINGMKEPELKCRPHFVIICIVYELRRT